MYSRYSDFVMVKSRLVQESHWYKRFSVAPGVMHLNGGVRDLIIISALCQPSSYAAKCQLSPKATGRARTLSSARPSLCRVRIVVIQRDVKNTPTSAPNAGNLYVIT